MSKNTLILGIGNDILTDDGIGPCLVNYLKKQVPDSRFVFQTTTLGGLDILEIIQGYKKIVFIDAIRTENGKPGTVYQFTPQDFQETLHLSNLHDVSFLEAIQIGEKLGLKIPQQISIIAIEIVEDKVFGTQFTPAIQTKYESIFEQVLAKITQDIC